MGRPRGKTAPRQHAPPLEKEAKVDVKEQKKFYDDCLQLLKQKHGDATFYLPQLELYVMTTLKAKQMMEAVMKEGATVQHTNKSGHTNNAENPRVRTFKMLNDQAMKLGKELGITNVSKVRKTVVKDTTKRGFKLDGKV